MSTHAKTRYTMSKSGGPSILDATLSNGVKADNMAGMVINGTTAYCAKRCDDGSGIYVIKNISDLKKDTQAEATATISYAVHGMTYCKKYLYMTCYKNKVLKMSVSHIGTIADEFTVLTDNKAYIPQSITYYGTYKNEDLFIIGVEKKNTSDTFFYMIGTFSDSDKTFKEKTRFYVQNSGGYEQSQDIFYHSKYGLFIATNKRENNAFTNYNRILCVKLPTDWDFDSNEANTYYPYSEFNFNGGSSYYTKLVVKSLCIASDGNLYLATNVTPVANSSGFTTDGIFRATNPVFPATGIMEVNLSSKQSVTVPNIDVVIDNKSYTCENLGAFTLNGSTGYCLLSHTTNDDMQNKASVLLSSSDISSVNFTRISGSPILRTMGHGNGMTYANGYLFVAAHDKTKESRRSEIAKLDPITGNLVETYQCDQAMGGISYYGYDTERNTDLFIVVNYDMIGTKPYAEEPEFYIGYLESGKFTSIKHFSVQNPSFISGKKNYLQDIYYDTNHGLFYCTLIGKVTKIYRILPEQIQTASNTALIPVEVFTKDALINEIESFAIHDSGILYIAQNCGDDSSNTDAVTQINSPRFIKY